MSALGRAFLADARRQYAKLRRLAESALEQVSDAQFFAVLDRMGKPWAKGEKKASVMVFIGKKLPKDLFIAGLEQCLA